MTTHVTFTAAAAGSLREALDVLGRRDPVLALDDNLACGPIDAVDAGARDDWWLAELGDPWPDYVGSMDRFWNQLAMTRGDVVAWMSRRSARESCGLRALVSRLSDRTSLGLVDIADVAFPTGFDLAMCFSFLNPEQIIEHALVDRVIPIATGERDAYRAEWTTLVAENSALRVMTPTGLRSAPIAYLDELVVARAMPRWQRFGYVIGTVMGSDLTSYGFDNGVPDTFIVSRMFSLVDDGVLEDQHDLPDVWDMRESWIRLAP